MAAPNAQDDLVGLALTVSQQAYQIRQLQVAFDRVVEQLKEAQSGDERREGEPGL